MPRTCLACSHPQRVAIDTALAAGEPLRNVAKRVSISHTALFRHKSHINPPPPPLSTNTPSSNPVRAMQRSMLTPKQSLLVKNLATGMTITDAAIKAGYSDSSRMTAGQLGSQALQAVRRKMPEILEQHGLTDSVLVEKYLKPLLEAKETKFFQKDGKVVETREVEALGTRTAALDIAFRVGGCYPERNNGGINVGSVNILLPCAAPPAWAESLAPSLSEPRISPSEPHTIDADKVPWAQPSDESTEAHSSDAPHEKKLNGGS